MSSSQDNQSPYKGQLCGIHKEYNPTCATCVWGTGTQSTQQDTGSHRQPEPPQFDNVSQPSAKPELTDELDRIVLMPAEWRFDNYRKAKDQLNCLIVRKGREAVLGFWELSAPEQEAVIARLRQESGHNPETLLNQQPNGDTNAPMPESKSSEPYKQINQLREWAKAKYGEEPYNPTEPAVGGEILRFGFDQDPEDGEKYIYTQEMFEDDVKKRPWNYKPRWIYELQDLIEADEL